MRHPFARAGNCTSNTFFIWAVIQGDEQDLTRVYLKVFKLIHFSSDFLSEGTSHCLQSLKLVAVSTTWRHFESFWKWSDSMLPESLWGFFQDAGSDDPSSFL
jgi:hypothetical protein